MKFSIFQDTRQGQRRYNQDRIAYCYSRDALLMVVALSLIHISEPTRPY